MNSLKDKIEAIDKALTDSVYYKGTPYGDITKARTLLAELKRELEPQANVIKSVCANCGEEQYLHSNATWLCRNRFNHFKETI